MSFQELFPIELLTIEQWQALFPMLAVAVSSILGLLLSPIPRAGRVFAFASVAGGLVLALIGLSFMSFQNPVSLLDGVLYFDRTSQVFTFMLLVASLSVCLMTLGFDRREHLVAEFYPLVAMATVGMIGLVSSQNLMFVFISLELMSLAVYVLVGLQRYTAGSSEAALKYFLLGAAASSVYLFGCSLLYGTTGTLHFQGLAQASQTLWQGQLPSLTALGLVLVGLGFLFKIGAVPFHSWVPDVYAGASTPVTGYMISAVKLAAVGVLLRIMSDMYAVPGLLRSDGALMEVLTWVTFLSLAVGSLLGLVQTQMKRMLAYSTIAHSGYLLLGFIALSLGAKSEASEALATYSIVYTIMNLGAFAVLTLLDREGSTGVELKDLAGLGKRRPYLAFALTLFLLSMAGIPPTAGFIGKYYLFAAAVASGEYGLTIIAALASVISAAFYLKPIVLMYMQEPDSSELAEGGRWFGGSLVVALSLVATVLLGLLPSFVSHLLRV